MNFLDLCKALRREAGIAGTGPGSVENQTGKMLDIVQWTADAYKEICAMRPAWKFLRTFKTFVTADGDTNEYDIEDDLLITDLARFDEDATRIYLDSTADQTRLDWFDWRKFRDRYNVFPEGRPTVITRVRAGDTIALNRTPDDAYTLTLDYWKIAPALAVNADTPLIPERFHMVIVWYAVMNYAGNEITPEIYSHAKSKYGPLMSSLMLDQGDLPTGLRTFPTTRVR